MLAGRVTGAARNLVRPLRVELGHSNPRLSVPAHPLAGLHRFSPSFLVTRVAHSHSRPLDAVHAMSKPYKKRVIQADSDESDSNQPEVRLRPPTALPLLAETSDHSPSPARSGRLQRGSAREECRDTDRAAPPRSSSAPKPPTTLLTPRQAASRMPRPSPFRTGTPRVARSTPS